MQKNNTPEEIMKPLYDDSYVSLASLIPKAADGTLLKDYLISVTSFSNRYVITTKTADEIYNTERGFVPFNPTSAGFQFTLYDTINEAVIELRNYLSTNER